MGVKIIREPEPNPGERMFSAIQAIVGEGVSSEEELSKFLLEDSFGGDQVIWVRLAPLLSPYHSTFSIYRNSGDGTSAEIERHAGDLARAVCKLALGRGERARKSVRFVETEEMIPSVIEEVAAQMIRERRGLI